MCGCDGTEVLVTCRVRREKPACPFVCVRARPRVCARVCVQHACMHACKTHTNIHTHMHVCKTHTYIHTDSYKHTYTQDLPPATRQPGQRAHAYETACTHTYRLIHMPAGTIQGLEYRREKVAKAVPRARQPGAVCREVGDTFIASAVVA